MDYQLSDQEQKAMLKKWWKDYGRYIAIAILIGLLGRFAYQYWQNSQLDTKENASALYQHFVLEVDHDHKKSSKQLANLLKQRYPQTPYSVLAAFWLGKEAANSGHYQQAIVQFSWVRSHTHSKQFLAIADLRRAQVMLETKQYDKALVVLNAVNASAFLPMAAELKGDVYLAKKDRQLAKKAYEDAKKGYDKLNLPSNTVMMKLSHL